MADSSALREAGNAFYKSGKLDEAIEKYSEAAKVAPDAPEPLHNLSAAYFESNRYTKSIEYAQKALDILQTDGTEGKSCLPQVAKLKGRISKAESILASIKDARDAQPQKWSKILLSVPRTRASQYAGNEFYSVGHDTVLNLFDKDLRQDSEDTQKSFFFAGIGDARHLFGTLLAIAEHERDQKENQNSVSYHFTINDLNVLALCRDLIVFMLLEDASRLDEGTPRHADIMNALFFVYVSILMPTYALEVLDDTIDTAITALKNREQPVSWLHIHEPDFPLYIQGLERWMGEARTLCTVDVFLKAASKGRLGSHHGDMSKPLKKESLLYRNASLLYPSRAVLYARDPDLSKILDGLPSKPKATDSRKVRQHVKDNWKPNVTLVDPMWIKGRPENLDIGHDPFDLVDQVDTKYTEQRNHLLGLFDIMEPFFKDITCALVLLRGKMRIEAIHGDCIDLFERLRYDIIPERKQDPANEDGGKWARPVRFDRIHLSNIPDYIGGHLSTFLYAMPLTKATRSHYMTSNCLRNSSSFASEEHYLTEYQLVTDTNMLAQLFGIRILQRGEPDEFSFLPSPIPLANYVYWQQPMKGRLKFGFLLPRKDFNRWFYALFFRLLLPMNTDIRMYHMIVLSPLNITILFRLMIHLQRIGYPSHWLAEVLSNILEDKVTSTCRPPRTTPLQIKDVLKDHPSKHLTTRPFAEELATFTAIFQPLLPLYISPTLLPQRESIHRYSFSLTRSMELRPQSQNMILVLFDDKIVPPEAMFNVRPLLDPSWGEIDSRFEDPRFQMGRKEGIFVWLTIERDFENHTVEAWMPDRFVDRLKALGWAVSLWRGDTYNSIWDGEKLDRVRDVATKGKPWVDTGVD